MPPFSSSPHVAGAVLTFSLALACSAFAQTEAPDTRLMIEGKVRSQKWSSRPTQTLANLPGYTPVVQPIETDVYGGWPAVKAKATGFFTTTKINGRFWLIDPLATALSTKLSSWWGRAARTA